MTEKKRKFAKRENSFTSAEGLESVLVSEITNQVFPKQGNYIPRVITTKDDEGKEQIEFDFRVYLQNDQGKLYPTGRGFRGGIRTARGLFRALRQVKRYLLRQDLWTDE
jgi:hypothetical protein